MPLIIRRANLTRAILIIHSDRWVCFVCVCWHCCVVFVANISAASNDFRMIMINTRKVHGTCVFGWTEGTRHHRIAGRSLERKCCRIDDDFRWSARVDVDVNNRRKNSQKSHSEQYQNPQQTNCQIWIRNLTSMNYSHHEHEHTASTECRQI